MFNDIINKDKQLNESYIFDEDDLYYNFDEWKKEKGKNLLFITGLIGSGKTTLANQLSNKYNAQVVHLDFIEDCGVYDGYEDKYIKAFFDKNPKYAKLCNTDDWSGKNIDVSNMYYKVIAYLTNRLSMNKNKLYIIEGIQVYIFMNWETLSKYSLIIKGTSHINSAYRWLNRGAQFRDITFAKMLFNELKVYGLERFTMDYNDEEAYLQPLRKIIRANRV